MQHVVLNIAKGAKSGKVSDRGFFLKRERERKRERQRERQRERERETERERDRER